jgi:hypothetical protein
VQTHRGVALTVGAIARELGEPIHRVAYAIRTRGIDPECLAGHIRVFAPDAIERVSDILREIDRQTARGQGGDHVS